MRLPSTIRQTAHALAGSGAPFLLVTGPPGSGRSTCALTIAEEFKGQLVIRLFDGGGPSGGVSTTMLAGLSLQAAGAFTSMFTPLNLLGGMASAGGTLIELMSAIGRDKTSALTSASATELKALVRSDRQKPFVLLLDDLDAAPLGFAHLVDDLRSEFTARTPFTIIATAGPEWRTSNGGELGRVFDRANGTGHAALGVIEQLSADAVLELIGDSEPDVVPTLLAITGGILAAVDTVWNHWISREIVYPDPETGRWRFATQPSSDPWRDICDYLYERLRSTLPESRTDVVMAFIEYAAVLAAVGTRGQVFAEVVTSSANLNHDEAIDSVDDYAADILVDMGFETIQSGVSVCAYRFVEPRLAHAVVAALSPDVAMDIARNLAETLPPDSRFSAAAARLYAAAGDSTNASMFAEQACHYLSPEDLIALISLALSDRSATPPWQYDAYDLLHAATLLRGRIGPIQELEVLFSIVRVARKQDARVVELHAFHLLAGVCFELGDYRFFRIVSGKGLQLAEEVGTSIDLAAMKIHAARGTLLRPPEGMARPVRTARRQYCDAVRSARSAANHPLLVAALYDRAKFETLTGDLRAARRAIRRARAVPGPRIKTTMEFSIEYQCAYFCNDLPEALLLGVQGLQKSVVRFRDRGY